MSEWSGRLREPVSGRVSSRGGDVKPIRGQPGCGRPARTRRLIGLQVLRYHGPEPRSRRLPKSLSRIQRENGMVRSSCGRPYAAATNSQQRHRRELRTDDVGAAVLARYWPRYSAGHPSKE